MAATSSVEKYRHDKDTNQVQDFGGSAKRQAIQLGQEANVFSAVIYYNPISRRLDGAVHVPRGQIIPDVNQFLREHSNGRQSCLSHYHRKRAQRGRRTSTPRQNEIPVETINKAARREGTADATVLEAAVTLCRIQEKPCHVATSVAEYSKTKLQEEMKFRTAQEPETEVSLHIGLDNLERPSSVLASGAIKDGPASHANNAAFEKSPSISHGASNCSVAKRRHSAHLYRESALNPTPVMAYERPRGETPRMASAREQVQFFERVSKQFWLATHRGHPSVTLNAESAPVDLAVRHNSDSRGSSAEFSKVPQRMAVDGIEPLLKARDRLPSPVRIRSKGLGMLPKDALKAAEIRRHRLIAMQLRRDSQHAK